jgi:hypothetical protein
MMLSAGLSRIGSTLHEMSVFENMMSKTTEQRAASNIPAEMLADVMDALGDMITNLAKVWLERHKEENRLRLLETFMPTSSSSSLSACAYWLLVRLGKENNFLLEFFHLTDFIQS